MILKLVKSNKRILFCNVLSQTLSKNIYTSKIYFTSDIKSYIENNHSNFATKFGRRARKLVVKINLEHIDAVTAVLKKHNVDTSNLNSESDIFRETSWTVEKRIMILEELGSSNITTESIALFNQKIQLPVRLFKAHMAISCKKSMAENLFLYMNHDNFDPQEIDVSEDQPTKVYFHRCLIHYTEKKLELNQIQRKILKNRNSRIHLYHSFRLLSKVLQFLENTIKLNKNKLIAHHLTLLSLHPDQFHIIYNLVSEIANKNTQLVVQRYPPVFEHNLEDLKIIVSFLKNHVSATLTTSPIVKILQMTSDELRKRFDYFSRNPYTQNLLKHPKFINLIPLYHCVLPRLRYLEEQNLQYATIQSLTCGKANFHEDLTTSKGLRKYDIKSFFYVNFGNDAEKALEKFKKHVYYRFVPLLSLRKSLDYLKGIFPYDVIKEHSYAILYNQMDLQAAYEEVIKNPDYCKLPANQLLTMCLYKIELNNHFMGDPVLVPGKYAESLKENIDQVEQTNNLTES